MITKEKIDRINFLAKKSKTVGLNQSEKDEQQALRAEYVKAFKQSLVNTLDSTVIQRPDGKKEKLVKKPGNKYGN